MRRIEEVGPNDLFDMLDQVISSLGSRRLLFPSVPVAAPGTQQFKPLNSKAVPAVPVFPTQKQEAATDTPHTDEENDPPPNEKRRASSLYFMMGKTGTTGTPAETLGNTVPVAFLNGNNFSLNQCAQSLSRDLRDAYEERSAIMEFDADLPRAEAERLAWMEVFGRRT